MSQIHCGVLIREENMVAGYVSGVMYDKAVQQLENILAEDPDFETDSEAEFVSEISADPNELFRMSVVKRVASLHKKYVK